MSGSQAKLQPAVAAFFVGLFAVEPLLDLFWNLHARHLAGQAMNPAAIAGICFLGIPLALLWNRGSENSAHAFQSELRKAFILFCAIAAYFALKCLIQQFTDVVLMARVLSSLSVLLLLIYFIPTCRLLRWQVVLFSISIVTIIVIAFLQVLCIYPMTMLDTLNSVNVLRVTGGYGHPLVLLEVLTFSALLFLYGLGESSETISDIKRIGLVVVCYATLSFIVFRSTYRTGLTLFLLMPLIPLIASKLSASRKIMCSILLYLAMILVFHFGSMGVVTFSNIYDLKEVRNSVLQYYSVRKLLEKSSNPITHQTARSHYDLKQPQRLHPAAPVHISPTSPISSAQKRLFLDRTRENLLRPLRGRGSTWSRYMEQSLNSSLMEIVFGHRNVIIVDSNRDWREPHNLFLMLFYGFGVFGFGLVGAFYSVIWAYLRKIFFQNPIQRSFVTFCMVVPLWFGVTSEPLRYPTFFSMLFLSIAMIAISKDNDSLRPYSA